MAEKIDRIPAKKLDTSTLYRADIDYGNNISDYINKANKGAIVTLSRHMATSKSNNGLQEVINLAKRKGKYSKAIYKIENAKKGIDINKYTGDTEFSNQEEVLLKKGTKLKKIDEKMRDGIPFILLRVVE